MAVIVQAKIVIKVWDMTREMNDVRREDIYDVQLTSRIIECRELERKAWVCKGAHISVK